MKLQDMKMTDQMTGHEIAEHEFAGHKNARHEIAVHENARLAIAGQKNRNSINRDYITILFLLLFFKHATV